MVRNRFASRAAKGGAIGARLNAALILILTSILSGCVSHLYPEFPEERIAMPHFDLDRSRFVSFDGAELGLTVWGGHLSEPEHVVVGIHGMNDYANAFHMAGPWWAERGVLTYAYDQRGFGRSPNHGRWPNEDTMREDLRTIVRAARQAHPEATLTVVGISMGGAVAMSVFGAEGAPDIDRLILSGPGLRGMGAIPFYQKIALQLATRVRPNWVVTPPRRFVRIEPSDNVEMLERTWSDPLMQRENRIDQVYGVAQLMETAHQRAQNLPERTLLLYGAKDYVIPPSGVERTAQVLPSHVRTAYYENGYHMLMRDLQAETVWQDQLAFMIDPEASLPSGASALPWIAEN
tara:strand:+ start:30084 stop:31127 length:1044 start_codon:yes stop_codon:yes gene_type:complete